MPKARLTCTRCSQRRQKCDRQTPCGRCVANNEASECTTEWVHGYNPNVHRKYPRNVSTTSKGKHLKNGLDASRSLPSNQQSNELPLHQQSRNTHPADNQLFPAASSVDGTRLPLQEPTPPSHDLDFIRDHGSDYTDISLGALLSNKEEVYARTKALANHDSYQSQYERLVNDTDVSGFSTAARAVEVYHLRSLLPTRTQLYQLYGYHEKYANYWSGGVYHGPSFRKSLLAAYGQADDLDLPNLDWRWTALLFSILSAAVIGSPEEISAAWGYSTTDKLRLAKQWANATISSLHLGDFASKYHVYSIQAIMNLHISNHLVGSHKEWAVYSSGAVVIAKSLGLHRLGLHADDGRPLEMDSEQKEALIQREVGRRIWYALVSQDWLCSTSQGLYSIQKRHFETILPGHFDEETMTPVTDDTPVYTQASNYLNEIAYLLIKYHDDILDAPDLDSKYNVVLRYDARIRATAVDKTPTWLAPSTPSDPSWPRWVCWARHLHQASWAHKIIMMHQVFLGRSFKSPKYTYTRWACTNAAKIVIEEMAHERAPEEPQWWVEHAFVVTAGICLALDIFHRSDKDPEGQENHAWLERAIASLEKWPLSSVAIHGMKLLTSLNQEYKKKFDTERPTLSFANMPTFSENIALDTLARAATESTAAPLVVSDPAVGSDGWPMGIDFDMVGFEDLIDTLPMEAGLDNNMFFESMSSLAN